MGNDEDDTTSGIEKLLKKGPSFIQQQFLYSAIKYNYMDLGCSKVIIPGREVKKSSTFYLFNIEGFFDIENGFYFSFLELLKIIIALQKTIDGIDSYDELESYIKIGIKGVKILVDLGISAYKYYSAHKKDKNEIEEEEKLNQTYNSPKGEINKNEINNDTPNGNSCENVYKYGEMVYEIAKGLKPLINLIPSKYFDEDKLWSWIRGPLKFLKELIGFKDLKMLILEIIDIIEDIAQTAFGIHGMANAAEMFAQDKVLGILYGVGGAINFLGGGVDLAVKTKNAIDRKKKLKRNKHQKNFLALLNLMKIQMQKMKNKNYKDLYENNVIILSIDLTDDNSNEGVDCKLVNIKGIEDYATPLNYRDNKRKKYITNIIEFYSILLPKIQIPDLTENSDNDTDKYERKIIEKSYYFLLYTKETILNQYNNKNFWINATEYQIRDLINNNEINFNKILSEIAANEINEDTIKKIYSKEFKTIQGDNGIKNNWRKKYNNKYNISQSTNGNNYFRPMMTKRIDYNKELNENLLRKNYDSNKREDQKEKKINKPCTYYSKENKFNNSKYTVPTFPKRTKRSHHNFTEIKDYANNSFQDGDFGAPPTAYFRRK